MIQKLFNCFKTQTTTHLVNRYEKDVLSSMLDVLPSHSQRTEKSSRDLQTGPRQSGADLNKQPSIASPDTPQMKFNFSASNSVVPDDQDDNNQYCRYVFDYISLQSKIRIWSIHIYESKVFNTIITIFTTIYLIIILVEPINNVESGVGFDISENVKNGFGYTSIAIYVLHHLICILSLGVWNHKYAYYRDPIAFINLICLFFIVTFQKFELNIFRMLFLVEQIQNYKFFKLLQRLSQTAKHKLMLIFYILFLILFILTAFSIMGLQIWSGNLSNYCLDSNNQIDELPPRLCSDTIGRKCSYGYICKTGYSIQSITEISHNFISYDTLPQALITTFSIQQVEGYVPIEQMLADSVNRFFSTIFTWAYLIYCTFFLQNLIVAAFLQKYQQDFVIEEPHQFYYNTSNKIIISSEKKKTIFININYQSKSRKRAQQILAHHHSFKDEKSPRSRLYKIIKLIVQSKRTKLLYSLLFLSNLILFSFNNEDAFISHYEELIAKINLAWICLYLLEDCCKLYIWNKKFSKIILVLEFCIDITSLICQAYYINSPVVLNSLKALRLLWFFNTQTDWSNYRVLLSALQKSFQTTPNLLLILLVYYSIIGSVGRMLFAGMLKFDANGNFDLEHGTIVPRINFDSLRDTFSAMSVIVCSDQWQDVFYSTLQTGNWLAYPYFIIALVIAKLVILPSFLTVMLHNYGEAKNEAEKQRTKAENVVNTLRKTTRAQIAPAQQHTPQTEKKKYFGRSSQLSDDSENDDIQIVSHINHTQTIFHRSASRIPPVQNLSQEQQQQQQQQQIIWKGWKDHFKNSSYFILNIRSPIRKKLIQFVQYKQYEWLMSILIVLSMILLGFDNPLDGTNNVIQSINIVFTVLFTTDILLKSISSGFLYNAQDNSKAYIRNKQNCLDLIIVILTSIHDYGIYASAYFNSAKPIRCLRILVSLRRGSQNEKINLIAGSLLQTISLLSSMIFVSGISIWILSIFCMTLWKGQLYFCYGADQYIDNIFNEQDCTNYGGSWVNNITNFDTIQDSLISLFRLIIGEGWAQLMFAVSDITGRGSHPKPNSSGGYQIIFYILLFVLNIMLLNLFFGLIINNYRTIKENIENYKNLNKNQRQWLEMQNIMQKKNLLIKDSQPENELMALCFTIAKYEYFEHIVSISLIINLIFCAAQSENLNDEAKAAFTAVNIVFITLFHIEIVIRILAYWELYFKDPWNRVDVIFLIITDLLIIIQAQLPFPRTSMIPLILRCLTSINITKQSRLNRNLKVLVEVVRDVLPTLLSVVALILVTTIIYALIGNQIFSTIKSTPQDPQYPYYQQQAQRTLTFATFWDALLILIEVSTGQYWTLYMNDYTEDKDGCHSQSYEQIQAEGVQGCGTQFAYLYFISYLVLIRIIMISLFLAMIIESYSDYILESTAVISPSQLEDFLHKWKDYDPQGTGWITSEDFAFLMFEMYKPLGFKDENTTYPDNNQQKLKKACLINHKKRMYLQRKEILKNLRSFNIPIYQNQLIHFKDVCIQLSHNAVCDKNGIAAIEAIEDKVVMRKIRKSWENRFPELSDFQIEKKLGYAVDYFAQQSISKIYKDMQEKKKIKEITEENRVQNKLKLVAQNEVQYLTKQNAEKSRRKSIYQKKNLQMFSQRSRFDDRNLRKNRRSQQMPSLHYSNSQESNLKSESNLFKIEYYNGFPSNIKVVYETQKIDFQEQRDSQQSIQQLQTSDQPTSNRLKGGISEKGSDEENQQDTVIYRLNQDI